MATGRAGTISGQGLMSRYPSKKRGMKSFSGCMSCKKKRKKCDEKKPKCSRCVKGNEECSWPNFCVFTPKNDSSTAKKNVIGTTVEETSENKHMPQEAMTSEEQVKIVVIGAGLGSVLPLSLVGNETECFMYFINKFLPSLLHPFVHDLSIEGLFIQCASEFKVLREIFIACGAAMIAFENENYKEFSYQKYVKSLRSLSEEFENGSLKGSEDWLFMAAQTLQTHCFRENNICLPAMTVAPHITASYQIMKKRFMYPSQQSTYEIQGFQSAEEATKPIKVPLDFSPMDRALIESFLFNYPIAIFFGKSDKLEMTVPNPFEFFSLSEFWTAFNNFENDNRINILSKSAFEIASKTAWICRLKLPLNEVDYNLCKELHSNCYNLLEDYAFIDLSILTKSVKQSVSIGKIVARISFMLLIKMLNFNTTTVEDLQVHVDEILEEIQLPFNDTLILPGWTLLVAMCCSIHEKRQMFFRKKFDELLSRLNSNMLLQIINFADSVTPLAPNRSFNMIFDTKIIDMICLADES